MGAREGVAVQAGMPGLGKEGKDYVSFLRTHEGKPGMFQTIFKFHTCVLKLLKRMKITATSSSQSFLRTPWREGHREGQLGERGSGGKTQQEHHRRVRNQISYGKYPETVWFRPTDCTAQRSGSV